MDTVSDNRTPNARRAHCPVEAEVSATFDQWMGDRSVYWSPARDAWIVTGYAEAASILQDSDTFWRDIPLREGAAEFWGRHLLIMEGRDHRRMHALHMKLTGEAFAEQISGRASEIARERSSRLAKAGRAELAADYADAVVFLIGCDFVGFDTTDESLMESLLAQMRIRATWKEALHSGSGISLKSKIAQDGQAALKTMASLLLPIIRDHREHP